jgi:undecaprenyl pyrophosphate phosphatase UppP
MGITLLTACWRRMTWQASLTYSFLLSIPIVLLGAFEELLRLNPSELTHNGAWQQLTAGALVAGAAGLVAASFLRGRLGRKSLLWLTGWCLMLGGTTVTVLIAASLN